MSHTIKFNLLTCNSRSGTKNGRDWIMTEAKGVLQVADKDGDLRNDIASVMMPKGSPLSMPPGLYDLFVDHYIDRESKLQFAVRKVEPSKLQQPVKAA